MDMSDLPFSVRTACGSGWLISGNESTAIIKINHPLPQVVLTRSHEFVRASDYKYALL